MNKQELIDNIAESADISKASASRALDAVVDSVTGSLKAGDSLTLVGFGTFFTKTRPARIGRNPRTGKPIHIAEKRVVVFKPGKSFRERLAKAEL